MRRPILFLAIAFGSGMLSIYFLDFDVRYLIGGYVLFAIIGSWSFKRMKALYAIRVIFVFLCAFLLGGSIMQWQQSRAYTFESFDGKSCEMSGIVKEIKQKDDGYKILLETDDSKLLVSCYEKLEDYRSLAGKTVKVFGVVSLPAQRRNPKGFDYRLYLKTIGVYALLNAKKLEVLRGETDCITKIRDGFVSALEKGMSKESSGIVNAMLFGDTSLLEDEIYESFQRNGTAHILSVSGLHVGIIYGFFCLLWRKKKGALFHITILILLLFYTALASFSPSVVRATIMIILHLISTLLHRRYDLLSAAAFTFIIMLCFTPMQLFHIGFQLSFLAMISLGIIVPFIKGFYSGIFLSGIAIQLGMGPYVAYVFNYFSFSGLIANIPIIFLSGILIPAGIILIPLSLVSQQLFGWGVALLEQGCKLLVFVNDLIYAGGRFSFDVISPSVLFLVIYYGILFVGLSEKGRIMIMRRKKHIVLIVGAVIVAAAIMMVRWTDDGFSKAKLVFVDVGQGDCLHIKTDEGKNYLIDGGGSVSYDVGKQVLKPYLLKNGVKKIDVAFVTHLHTDHYAGIVSLMKEGMIEKIAVYEGNQGRAFPGTQPLFLHRGQQVKLGDDVHLQVLHPESREASEAAPAEEDENASSLIMKLNYKGTTVMMTGDISTDGEEVLIQSGQDLHTDILKIAHHGSKYSSSDSFLEAVSPKVAVVQVGRNNFGHPTQEVLEKCRQKDIMLYRNDRSGAIGICWPEDDNKKYYVKRMINGKL